jgi:hypothetical protein
LQNLAFLTAGTAQFTGTNNNGTVYPLQVTLDNVSFPGTFPPSDFSPAPTNAALTYGPGLVSSDFVSDYATFVGSNGNTVTNNITVSTLFPPTCSFTSIAPELTGPSRLAADHHRRRERVGSSDPHADRGRRCLSHRHGHADGRAHQQRDHGNADRNHRHNLDSACRNSRWARTPSPLPTRATSNYTLTSGQTVYSTTGPYVITVNAGSLGSTTTALSGVPSSTRSARRSPRRPLFRAATPLARCSSS